MGQRAEKPALSTPPPHEATPRYPPPHPTMGDTLHLHLTHEELKDLLRRRFARAGLEPPILDAIEDIALLIRRHGFAAFLEGLELAVQELSQPPVPPIPFAEWLRLTEDDIAAFQARMREVTPAYRPGDRVELHGEVYEIFRYQREGESGYWLRRRKDEVFIPVDQEKILCPVLH